MENLFDKTPLGQMLKRGMAISEDAVFIEIISDFDVRETIVKMNTDQMKQDFMDSKGVLLSDIGGGYSDYTVAVGGKSGKFNVDLYDTGDFHRSFRVENISGTGFSIISDPIKDDGTNLLREWGEDVEGLTFENLDKLALFLLNLYQIKVLKILLG
jgi:hypothetical protein